MRGSDIDLTTDSIEGRIALPILVVLQEDLHVRSAALCHLLGIRSNGTAGRYDGSCVRHLVFCFGEDRGEGGQSLKRRGMVWERLVLLMQLVLASSDKVRGRASDLLIGGLKVLGMSWSCMIANGRF